MTKEVNSAPEGEVTAPQTIWFDWSRFREKVQMHLPKVGKDGEGNYGSYMKLEDLNPAVLKVMNDNGFAWVTKPTQTSDGKPGLRYMLIDTINGGVEDEIMPLSLDKNTPQGQGSAITYARRYSLAAVTGIVADMDDDGQGAEGAEGDKTVEELKDIIDLALTKDDLRKMYAGLTATEKKLALPLVQEKISNIESA